MLSVAMVVIGAIITMMYFVIALRLLLEDDTFIKACGVILAVAYVMLFVICLGALL